MSLMLLPDPPSDTSTSAQSRLMTGFVDASSKAHASDVSEAQFTGRLAWAYRTGPGYTIAALVDTGNAHWAPAYFNSFIRYLHQTQRRLALEVISARTAFAAIDDAVRDQVADKRAWEAARRDLAAEATFRPAG